MATQPRFEGDPVVSGDPDAVPFEAYDLKDLKLGVEPGDRICCYRCGNPAGPEHFMGGRIDGSEAGRHLEQKFREGSTAFGALSRNPGETWFAVFSCESPACMVELEMLRLRTKESSSIASRMIKAD